METRKGNNCKKIQSFYYNVIKLIGKNDKTKSINLSPINELFVLEI